MESTLIHEGWGGGFRPSHQAKHIVGLQIPQISQNVLKLLFKHSSLAQTTRFDSV